MPCNAPRVLCSTESSSWISDHSFLDTIVQYEVEKRDVEIEDLKKKYSAEIKQRMKIEKKHDNIEKQLVSIHAQKCAIYPLHGLYNYR